jgi:hypothetical protein
MVSIPGTMKPLLLLLFLLLQDSKVAVPPDDALKTAEKMVRGEEVSLQRAKLLLDQGRETKDNDALRYVLYREAADVASRAGAIDTMVQSLKELYSAYQMPNLSLKESFHLRIEAGTRPEDLKRLAEADLALSQEAVELDQYEVAVKMAQASMSLGRKTKDPALTARGEAAARLATETRAAFDKARKAEEALAAAPEDPAANEVWGEWLCLHKGRWDKGLPFLTKGVDGPFRTAALKEFSSSAEVTALVEVGDAWWDLIDRERSPIRKQQLLAHARSVYATALPRSTGLVRAKIGRRLEFDRDPSVKEAVGREESEALKAEAALAANPNDPAANLALGKYLAFQKNEWAAAMPRLAKGADAVLKALAEKELTEPRTGPEKMDLGEAWADAAPKLPALKKNILDRATHWYVQAWPSVDGPSKDKLRERFRKLFQTAGSIGKAAPREWTAAASDVKAGVSSAAARTGRNGFQIACARSKEGPSVVLSQSVAARPLATYELSCWVVADETNGTDELQATVQTRDSRTVVQPTVSSLPDQPWFKRIEARFTAPETAAKIQVAFSVKSTKGTLFLDDLSLKQDGKELLRNGSFDE